MRWLIFFLLLALPLSAKVMMPDLVDIPVERLLANAERRVQKEPKSAQAQFVLGRIHVLAYAEQAAALPASRKTGEFELSPLGTWPPTEVKTPVTATARKQLKAAVAAYAKAVALDPSLLAARMSYAWALQQDGQQQAARTQYRTLIERAWPKEKSHQLPVFGRSFTREAIGYLKELLDPTKDAAELARLQQISDEAAQLPRSVTPILLPLAADTPFERLVDAQSPVRFDLDGSGRQRSWGWITPRAAWLVYLDRRDRVDSALQMFGSVSFLAFWENGYEALSSLDEDGDGWLSGSELRGLALWQDADQDGRCQPDEIRRLGECGITGLSCSWTRRDGYLESPAGVRYSDGREGPSYDWIVP